MPAEDIYDFEVVIAEAVKAVLSRNDINAYTILDPIEFQRTRPRVDVIYRHLGESSPQRTAKLPDGSFRTSCFRGELRIHAITDADDDGKTAHSRYRATVRNVIAALQGELNGSALTYHKIQFIQVGTEETGVRSGDGLQQTTFPFTVDISIQQDAWEHI